MYWLNLSNALQTVGILSCVRRLACLLVPSFPPICCSFCSPTVPAWLLSHSKWMHLHSVSSNRPSVRKQSWGDSGLLYMCVHCGRVDTHVNKWIWIKQCCKYIWMRNGMAFVGHLPHARCSWRQFRSKYCAHSPHLAFTFLVENFF
jgi:hypothetical protein